jgi:photosystem II stability/assembly factor-like uncharacterized protein
VAAALMFSLFTGTAWANWTILNSGTREDLLAVHCPTDGTTGYVVGYRGTILKTTDGGTTWRKQGSGTTVGLTGVHFPVDANTGYIVGGTGIILKTANGGAKWTRLNSGTSAHLRSVYFIDANTGYVGGDSQTVLKTTDGGQTWQTQYVTEGSIFAIQFPRNGQTGYAAAIAGSIGYLYKTVNGGTTWANVLTVYDAFFFSIHFPVDDLVGYVVNGDNYYQDGIYKTTDGGATWTQVNFGVTETPVAVYLPVDAQTGIAVGERGSIFKTTDGGAYWQEGRINVDSTLQDVHFVNATTGFLVGRGGVIARTTDGGAPNSIALHLHPTGPGSISEFTQRFGCAEAWDCMNDQAGNAGTGIPGEADIMTYIADGSGHREYFSLPDGLIGPGYRVTSISVNMVISPGGGPYVALGYKRAGIDPSPIESVPFWVGFAYPEPATWTWTGLDWRAADIDALEIGLRPGIGEYVEAAQIYLKLFYEPIP